MTRRGSRSVDKDLTALIDQTEASAETASRKKRR
jgi:hypothetical protein